LPQKFDAILIPTWQSKNSNTSKPPANGYLQVAAFPDILADGASEFVHDTSLSA